MKTSLHFNQFVQHSTWWEQLYFRNSKASFFTRNIILSLKSFLVWLWCYLSQCNEGNKCQLSFLLLSSSLKWVQGLKMGSLAYGRRYQSSFSRKSIAVFTMIKQRDSNRPLQIIAFLYLKAMLISLVLMVNHGRKSGASFVLRVFLGLTQITEESVCFRL